MNSITICGNITRDAEIKFMPTGDAVASFGVADNQGKDKTAIFWNCSLFGKRAQSLEQYLTKGQTVTIIGSVSEREYTNRDGVKVKAMDVRVQDVALQGGRKDDAPRQQAQAQQARPAQRQAASSGGPEFDADIPFAPIQRKALYSL